MRSTLIIVMALLLAGVLGESTSDTSHVVLAQTAPTVVPTALANERPDRCERNDSREEPCVLPLDAVSGPFTFLPDGDQDYYSVDLGDQPGLALSITVRGTSGLDLLTTVSRAADNATLATISSPAISTTLSADLIGWVILRVENRAPAVASGESYSMELRRVLPPPPPPTPDVQTGQLPLAPDPLENNWSPGTAAPIGVGYVYDLNFVCPVPWGCAGGDHDYLAVPVKAGVRYLIATFDLGPGVDTVIDLFWGDEQVPVAANDDSRLGASFLSVLRWVAPSDGTAVIQVGPRTGGANPIVFDKDASSYRFAIVLADSDLGHQLEERIATQTGSDSPAHQGTAPGAGTGTVNDHAPAPITVTACLGYNPTALERPRAKWGQTPDDTGRETFWLPPGIVIPFFVRGKLWKLSIRRLLPKMRPGMKYKTVPGSANTLYNADAIQPGTPALLCEGVIDALAVQQVAGDLVAAVAAGTTTGARRLPWIAGLATASQVLVAMDADAGGEEAAAYWLDVLQHNARRWRPLFDDPAAMLQAGLDVRQWVEAGLNVDELERSRVAIT